MSERADEARMLTGDIRDDTRTGCWPRRPHSGRTPGQVARVAGRVAELSVRPMTGSPS